MNGSEFRFHSATPPRRFDGSNQLSSGFPTFSFEQLSDSRFTSSSSGLTPSAQHTGGPGRSDFDFLRTENEISAASPGGLIGALDLDCDEEHAIEAPPRKFAIPVATADEDVFGFGDFGQVFVTEEDLDKAREKLSEDEVITPEQTVEHMLNVLQQWVTEQQTNDSPHDTSAFANVAICYNFVELGQGEVEVTTGGCIIWQGELLTFHRSAGSDALLSKREARTLFWPRSLLTDVRYKAVDDEKPIVAFTVAEEFFLQFSFPKDEKDVAERCAAAIRDAQKIDEPVTSSPSSPTPGTQSRVLPAQTPAPRRSWRAAVGIFPSAIPSPSPAGQTPNTTDDTPNSALDAEMERRRIAALECRDRAIKQAHENYALALRDIDVEYKQRRSELREVQRRTREEEEEKGLVVVEDIPLRECQLCFDGLESRELTPCGHRLCGQCADKLKTTSKRCPWDRADYLDIVQIDA